jgi:hypothetical protein
MTIEDLIDTITTWPVGMPVRAMEQLIAEGTAAVPALHQSLERWQDDETRDIIWIVVLLGEMRHADSIDRLIHQLRETDFDYLAAAASEALAKIGQPAVPALIAQTQAPEPEVRLLSYATLGWIDDDRCFNALTEGLFKDVELVDVIANALADQRRAEALPILYEHTERFHQAAPPLEKRSRDSSATADATPVEKRLAVALSASGNLVPFRPGLAGHRKHSASQPPMAVHARVNPASFTG